MRGVLQFELWRSVVLVRLVRFAAVTHFHLAAHRTDTTRCISLLFELCTLAVKRLEQRTPFHMQSFEPF